MAQYSVYNFIFSGVGIGQLFNSSSKEVEFYLSFILFYHITPVIWMGISCWYFQVTFFKIMFRDG